MSKAVLVTGGAGFIGSCFVLQTLRETDWTVINLDKLTYAGNLDNLIAVKGDPRHVFVQGDIGEPDLVDHILRTHTPAAVVNLAAESHVDRSIDDPSDFVRTNVLGTQVLLEASRSYLASSREDADAFRFVQVSTDEVFGSLTDGGRFSEQSPYVPSSPYAASKAAADHLARAYFSTYRVPTLVTHCGNNYGPRQFPEKLIPLMILNALEGKPLPVYGDGQNVRDWVFVEDHCRGLRAVLDRGRPGEAYTIGASEEHSNIQVVQLICALLDELVPASANKALRNGGVGSYAELVSFVTDRPGHDRRYAIDARKIARELGWAPQHSFEGAMRETVQWYLQHRDWCSRISEGRYGRERLGLMQRALET